MLEVVSPICPCRGGKLRCDNLSRGRKLWCDNLSRGGKLWCDNLSRGGKREGAVCLWISLSSCNSPLQLFFFISRVYTGEVDQKHRIPELGPWRPIFTEQARCIFEFSSNIFFTHILYIYDIFFRCRIFFVFYFSVSSFLFPFSLLSIWCKCKNSCCIYSTVLIFSNIGLFKMSLTFSLKGQYSVKLIWGNAMDTRISNLQ